ncbi:GNAT family N-acetyltransferase [Methylobacterium sp. J-090]|nr:GNAT family N-acetyltransferase [Methylobacterium sp. J-090]
MTVVRNHDDLGKVMAIRSSVYLAEQVCPYDEEFDGNDFAATHLLGYVGGEPAASIRIRCFADFAKVERLAVRHQHRKSRLALVMIRAAKELCRMKGYTRIYGQAQKRLVNMWSRSGARPIPNAPEITFSDFDYVQMLLETDAHPEAVTLESDPFKIIRPEGQWHAEGILEKSSYRPATRPSVDHPTIRTDRPNRRTA